MGGLRGVQHWFDEHTYDCAPECQDSEVESRSFVKEGELAIGTLDYAGSDEGYYCIELDAP